MKIAIVGSGGREHALGWKLAQTVDAQDIYFMPGNGGTWNNIPVEPRDFPAIQEYCRSTGIEMILVGPEQPLVDGIVDFFQATSIKVLGPDGAAARLEGSKIWAKEFMKRHGVATARSWVLGEDVEPHELLTAYDGNLVIKYDGLAAGKGVKVCSSVEEASRAIAALQTKHGEDARLIAEEKLSGQEISIIGFTDGTSVKLLLPSQDHKPIYDGDRGPNTGGMGAYCPVPFCDNRLLDEIERCVVAPTLRGIQAEGLNYRGIIYFGLMVTDGGPKVLEYNVRLGDPESEVVLPALKSDILALITACFDGTLGEVDVAFSADYFVDVVLASEGYPGPYETGFAITGFERLSEDTLVFHAGTTIRDEYLITAGGRVLNVVARASDLKGAIECVYEECVKLGFQGAYYRRDIGQKGLETVVFRS
jgi:phosphoribosylamine--glycine ligase